MLKFDEVADRLDKYIWYMAHRAVSSSRINGMDVSDLHQTGLIKLYELYSNPKYSGKPVAEFDAIFKRALFNAFADVYAHSNEEGRHVIQIDLNDISEEWGYSAFDEAYLKHYQVHLETLISHDAAVLLEHLLNPTPAVYHMHNIQRMRREALQRQGKAARVPQKLTQAIVGQTIGFSASKTKALIREIRNAWGTQCRMYSWRQSAATS